jgi:tetratricopeptide (TPR) repeat protein
MWTASSHQHFLALHASGCASMSLWRGCCIEAQTAGLVQMKPMAVQLVPKLRELIVQALLALGSSEQSRAELRKLAADQAAAAEAAQQPLKRAQAASSSPEPSALADALAMLRRIVDASRAAPGKKQETSSDEYKLHTLRSSKGDVPEPDFGCSEEEQVQPRVQRLKIGQLLLKLGRPKEALAELREALSRTDNAPTEVKKVWHSSVMSRVVASRRHDGLAQMCINDLVTVIIRTQTAALQS